MSSVINKADREGRERIRERDWGRWLLESYLVLKVIRPLNVRRHVGEVLGAIIVLLLHGVERLATVRRDRDGGRGVRGGENEREREDR